MRIYIDTSFLVSLYSPDANSAAAAATMQSSHGDHLVTTFAELELLNALQLRIFRKELSITQVRAGHHAIDTDLQSRVFQLQPMPEKTFERARQLSLQTTARLGTRTADLVHIAAALELAVDSVYSFDHQQRKLAHALRLKLN
ncbi:MAG TPA: type II toxin-antitoxin system VapC family toxin [Candidatus Angelobacter sp.]